jgi:hypothetical protein
VHHGDDTISGSSMPHLEQAVCMETPCRFIFEMYSSSDTEIFKRAEMTSRGEEMVEIRGEDNGI